MSPTSSIQTHPKAFVSERVHVNPELPSQQRHGGPSKPGGPSPQQPSGGVDEVDGIGEDILVPISKMVFLKIIFIDIGITAGIGFYLLQNTKAGNF